MPAAPEPFEARTFKFGCAIVRLYLDISKSSRVPPYLARQILASGTSIGANIEESRACQSRRDTAAKFSIALKEARETLYWLRLLAANDLLAHEQASSLMREANELIAILTVTRRRLAAPLEPGTSRTERPPGG
jgi:four helix bundle protein